MQKQVNEMIECEVDKPKKKIPIRMHIFRRAFDYLIDLESNMGKEFRENIRDGISITEEQKLTKGYLWKFMAVKLCEKNPVLLVAGISCWAYLIILVILKLTIMA